MYIYLSISFKRGRTSSDCLSPWSTMPTTMSENHIIFTYLDYPNQPHPALAQPTPPVRETLTRTCPTIPELTPPLPLPCTFDVKGKRTVRIQARSHFIWFLLSPSPPECFLLPPSRHFGRLGHRQEGRPTPFAPGPHLHRQIGTCSTSVPGCQN